MKYGEFVRIYENLNSTTKRLEKIEMLADFFRKLRKEGEAKWIYLLKGRVYADYDPREFGISNQLILKAIGMAFGVKQDEVIEKFKKTGDLGSVTEEFVGRRKQKSLFSSKRLDVKKVFDNLKKISETDGKGAVEKKMALLVELLVASEGKEAKYIVRTILGDLRVGVADALIIEGINLAFFSGEGEKEVIESKYDIANDLALIFEIASKGRKELEEIGVTPGRPLKVMLAVKVESIKEAFEICGKPAAVEYKYDGFRMLINKKGNDICLFTRRLENVTKQFPDVINAIKEHVKGRDFILDSEVVGYDSRTKKYQPFESISQRIKRKYDVEKLIKELPVEINVFDVLYYDGKNMMNEPFSDRRKLLERIIKKKDWVIRPSFFKIAHDEKEAEEFYKESLAAGEEGMMIKRIDAPYRPGRRVGYMAKLKPIVNDLDLVIVGAEYGTGKRAGWLTSYVVACKSGHEFLEVGMVSSGLKEKGEQGTSYDDMTKMLKPLITEENGNKVKVKPKIIVSVTYQNIQKSPSYSSGYAMRFPRITAYRPDKSTREINNIEDIEREWAGK